MKFSFDLISDLHVETWDKFDWTGQPTAPYCVVAGDISRDHNLVIETLKHLNQCYAGVFYIDGNEEHRFHLEDLGNSYRSLKKKIQQLDGVVFLQDNVAIINGVAILGTNGWWSYDLDPEYSDIDTQVWYKDYTKSSQSAVDSIIGVSYHDASYITNSIRKLQTHQEVKKIVIVTHTLPGGWLCNYDPDLIKTPRFNCMGNQHLEKCLKEDTEKKICVWAFGHYHRPIDQNRFNIRYVSNPRGKGNTWWSQSTFYPKRIEIEL